MKSKLILSFFMLLWLLKAPALTFEVIALNDDVDSNPGDGVCEIPLGFGFCSLRAAIMEANALGGSHTIQLGPNIHELTLLGDDDTAEAGDLDVTTGDVTIIGSGPETVINANGNNRIFEVFNGRSLSLKNLTLTGGRAATADNNGGGAIQVNDVSTQLFTDQVIITNNSANTGGGLFATLGADINIHNTVFVDNFTEDLGFTNIWGPAIFCSRCEMFITSSTFTGNDNGGKAIEIEQGFMSMTNSTVTNNEGGGIRTTNGGAKIRFSTFVSESGQNLSHFSFDGSDVVDIQSSILWTPDGGFIDNCQAGDKPTSSGYNIVSDASCEFSAVGDSEMTDALLASLANNGGFTDTFLPDVASPAVDLVPISDCISATIDVLEFDQRGAFRPDGNFCDAGAVELNLDVIFRDGFGDTE